MSSALLLSGSPRPGGNTDDCLELLAGEFTKAGLEVETIHTRDLAYRILELYWPQTDPYVTREGAIVLRQNSKGQAGIVRAIIDFRERHVVDGSTTLSRALVFPGMTVSTGILRSCVSAASHSLVSA